MQTGNLRQTGKNRAWKLRYRKVERRDGVVKKHRYDVLIGDASLTFEQAREIANKILRPINIQSATVRGKKTASTILKAAQKNDKKQRGALCSYCNIALGYAKEDEN